MKILKRNGRARVNVPVIRSSNSLYVSALHMSFMALALMASIFVIAFATFISAQAFTLQHENQGNRSLGYAAVENSISKFSLTGETQTLEVLPNVEETAFNAFILLNRSVQIIKIPASSIRPITPVRSVVIASSMSKSQRVLTIGFLGSLFAFMMWVTGRMWREFARENSVKRRAH